MDEELQALLNEVKMDLELSMVNVANEVVEVYQEHIEEDVYNAYYTDSYRRYNKTGGFADPNMIDKKILRTNNGIDLIVKNMSKARGINKGDYLDEIIEEGIYDFGNAGARPAYELTDLELNGSNIVENTLEYELKKRGWDLK